MTPEQKARISIDKKLEQSGWTVQDVKKLDPTASLGVAVREFPTDTGPVDYALFVNGIPVGVIEAKKSDAGENITAVEEQSARYANSSFKWVKAEYSIRFAYEATDKLIRFTDYRDIKFRSRCGAFSSIAPKVWSWQPPSGSTCPSRPCCRGRCWQAAWNRGRTPKPCGRPRR